MIGLVTSASPDSDEAKSEDIKSESSKRSSAGFDISIYNTWCKDCALCVEFCPRGVLAKDELGNLQLAASEKCIGCMQCVLHCPDFAISVTPREADETGAEDR